jgi:arginine N-succinyltransferase
MGRGMTTVERRAGDLLTESDLELVVRVARSDDVEAIGRLAAAHGGGMTNLTSDRVVLGERVEASLAALAEPRQTRSEPLKLVLEADGRVAGTAILFPHIGLRWPFYSYKINRLSQTSRQVDRSVAYQILTLTNDLDGAAEVAGLLVDPALRGRGAGRLIARSRYLFMAAHRELFGERVIAELRGWLDGAGVSPVWEAIGRRFYHMSFEEADRMSGAGGQFIADLGPRHPIYVNLLSDEAQAALGRPHAQSRPAFDLLIEEGFRFDGYVDIFDGGPTVTAEIDALKGVRDSRVSLVTEIGEPLGPVAIHLVAAGEGVAFRATSGAMVADGDAAMISPALAKTLGVVTGESIRHVAF